MTDWISVDDRLPGVGYEKPAKLSFIVTDGQKVWTETAHPKNWNSELPFNLGLINVTHWMPLPAPPK